MNVVNHVGRIISGRKPERPYELLVDGDLLIQIREVIKARGPRPTAFYEVKCHADEGLVRQGRVCELDKIGNDLAHQAADFGWRGVEINVIGARRALTRACKVWCPAVEDLHRFFFAIARAVVHEDGRSGTDSKPLVWCSGTRAERRRVIEAVRDFAMLPGPWPSWLGNLYLRWRCRALALLGRSSS